MSPLADQIKAALEQRRDSEAKKYAESCDNESGGFLSHQLEAIRVKASKRGADSMLPMILRLVEGLELASTHAGWALNQSDMSSAKTCAHSATIQIGKTIADLKRELGVK